MVSSVSKLHTYDEKNNRKRRPMLPINNDEQDQTRYLELKATTNGNELRTNDTTETLVNNVQQEKIPPFTKKTILKNTAVGCISFVCLYTAYQSVSNLQTSLNRDEGIGSISLSLVYVFVMVSCFFPKFVIARLGCKRTMAISMMGYTLYIAANLYAVKATMFISAIFIGLGASPLWTANFTYITQSAVWYAKLTDQDKNVVTNRFFGVFWLCVQTSHVWGNLVSSTVFTPTKQETIPETVCGAQFCGGNVTSNFEQDQEKVYTAIGIYVACSILAVLIVAILLDPITLDTDNKTCDEDNKRLNPKLLLATFKHLKESPIQMMLVPLTVYGGVEKAFAAGEYTKAYISCSLGIWNLGYVMVCYGVAGALSSYIFGHLIKFTGRISIFCLLFLVHGPLQIVLFLWSPRQDQAILFYIFAGLWGMGDAVVLSQLPAMYGEVFEDNKEAGFANYWMGEAVGYAVAYAYNNILCTDTKLLICMGMLSCGMVGYGAAEVTHRINVRRKKEHDLQFKNEA